MINRIAPKPIERSFRRVGKISPVEKVEPVTIRIELAGCIKDQALSFLSALRQEVRDMGNE